ncbi:MAG: polyprenyl synthetase family protein [Clostridia bacterium]|nr:polyprenyl synthetase family protein [Clostridia bacterium]
MDFKAKFDEYRKLVNDYIAERFAEFEDDTKLLSAMKYSMSAGGKRIRPVMLVAFSDAFGVPREKSLAFAFSLECIHTFSLIHDDLPAIDDDDMRRGRPSCHVVFGEAAAILAGDALLNLAYETCLARVEGARDVSALKYLADCAGFSGMIGGEARDVENQFSLPDEDLLLRIDALKTGKLLKAPAVIAGILAGADTADLEALGDRIGLIFQFSDDLLDEIGDSKVVGKTLKKDAASGKMTACLVYGVDGVKKRIEDLKFECLKIVEKYDNFDFIKNLIVYIAERNS